MIIRNTPDIPNTSEESLELTLHRGMSAIEPYTEETQRKVGL